jgi:Domain of unknown function (DUF6458)
VNPATGVENEAMRTSTGLALVAVGALLAFAVTTSPSFLNLQITGWVIMLTGVAGVLLPRRGSGRLRRRVVVWRPRAGTGSTTVSPGSGPRALGMGRVFRRPAGPGSQPAPPPAAGETIEEYHQE